MRLIRGTFRRSLILIVVVCGSMILSSIEASHALASGLPSLSDFSITFRITDSMIVPFQSLWVRTCVTNVTLDSLPPPNLFLGGRVFHAWIADSEGRTLPLPMLRSSSAPAFYDWKVPGRDSVVNYTDLSNSLWDPLRESEKQIKPGRYTLWVRINVSAFSGSVGSIDSLQSLPFWILPASNSDKVREELYLHAYRKMSGSQDLPGSRELLRELIDEHPESPLVESAFQLLFFIEGNSEGAFGKSEWVQTGHEILRVVPHSPLCCEVALNLMRHHTRNTFDSLIIDSKTRSLTSPLHEVKFREILRRGGSGSTRQPR